MTNNAMKSVILIKVIQPESTKFSITSDHVLIISLGISGIAFFLHFVFEYALSGFLALLATHFLPVSIITTIWGWNEYYPDKYNINGLISLSHLEISIDKDKYLLKELNNLKFHVNEFKGLRLRYPQLFPAGPCLSQGIKNYIKFNYQGNEYSFQFLLRSKSEMHELGDYLKELFIN